MGRRWFTRAAELGHPQAKGYLSLFGKMDGFVASEVAYRKARREERGSPRTR